MNDTTIDYDKELYNRYQDKIPSYEIFKSIKSKKIKTLLFTGWQTKFGSKQIRKAMNITYSTYDYNNRMYGSASGVINKNEQNDNNNNNNNNNYNNKKSKFIDVSGYTVTDKVIIEADFEEIDKTKKTDINVVALSTADNALPVESKKPFISVEWTNKPESIKEQLEALATLLKLEHGEITVKLDVFK